MARPSATNATGNTRSTYDGKCNTAREKKEARTSENRHLKHSMDAYYRPRQRELINVDNWNADDTEVEVLPSQLSGTVTS
jgi:hypothetical protein